VQIHNGTSNVFAGKRSFFSFAAKIKRAAHSKIQAIAALKVKKPPPVRMSMINIPAGRMADL
jgi:hypothetical protein